MLPNVNNELNILQCIIEHLNKFSNRKEVADVVTKINELLEGKTANLGSLRTQLLDIYKKENIYLQYYDQQFYNALFMFLLLLAKYNPPASYRNNDGELECPIGYVVIDPNDRLLTSNGVHFDRASLENWIKDKDIATNPSTQLPFSQRELSYLRARTKNLTPEIPVLEHAAQEPQPAQLSFKQKSKKFLKKCSNYLTNNVRSLFFQLIFVVFGAAFSMMLLAGLIAFGIVAPLSLGILGFALLGMAVLGGICGGSLYAILEKHCGQICFGIVPIQAPPEPPRLLRKNDIRPFINIEQSQFLLYAIQNQGQLTLVPESAVDSSHSTQNIQCLLKLENTLTNPACSPLLPATSTKLLPKNNAFLQTIERNAKNAIVHGVICH